MNNPSSHRSLIVDVLGYRRVSGSLCLVSNSAADELRQSESSVLPEIEEAILGIVVTDSHVVADHNELLHLHPGLLSLWIAYYQIGMNDHIARLAECLQSLDGPILATEILAMSSVWHNKGADVTLPNPLLKIVSEVATRKLGNAVDVARHQLQYYWKK